MKGKTIRSKFKLLLWLMILGLGTPVLAQQHPNLVLTAEGAQAIRQHLGNLPLMDQTLEAVKKEVDAEIASGIHLPVPADYSGGYTHERHKRNYLMMQKAGILFQVLREDKYALYVRDMLMGYAEMYPTLPRHPKTRSYARGKLFWQCLNDSNWLVYASQAYDCVYNRLSRKERTILEKKLFRPFADFISLENPQFFNRVHNHSTWGNVAVGMIGLVMNDEELIDRALYGVKGKDLPVGAKDDDGGYIVEEGQKAGFLANLEEPFSPDGYYTEGPYYQRYAMYPFLIFAQALEQNKPELKIFEYKQGVLLKSVYALLNLTDQDGEFFPLNDAQKGMSYFSRELVTAVDIAYHFGDRDPELLSIAGAQGRVALNDAGLSVAKAIEEGLEKPFDKRSVLLTDGSDGKQGGVAIVRKDDLELVFKYAAQGLSHGHYDKLSFSFYDSGEEVIQDYGLARFVNIEQKGGGNYLPENKTWAKQSIAHNTLVVDQESHFKGKYEIGSKHHSRPYYLNVEDKELQVVSAIEENAYNGIVFHRTMAVISDDAFNRPVVLDLMRVSGEEPHKMDLPFYYLGQPMLSGFSYDMAEPPAPMGKGHGYQHLYLEANGKAEPGMNTFSWMSNDRFYTLNLLGHSGDEMLLGRIGASDPDFNLRRDPVLIHRKNTDGNALYVSLLEAHGAYSPVTEIATDAYGSLKNMQLLLHNEQYIAISLETRSGESRVFVFCHSDSDDTGKHEIEIQGHRFTWQGPVYYDKF